MGLESIENAFPRGGFMFCDASQNAIERSDSKALVRGNGNALMDCFRCRAIKEKSLDGIFNLLSQFLPGIALGKDGFGQAFGGKASIGILRNLKYQLTRGFTI